MQNTRNFDLNLAPVIHPAQSSQSQAMSFNDWLLGSMREVVSNRSTVTPPVSRLAPVAATATNERASETIKANENGSSFFECNVCLDIASEPVVTCCGHLFCWACLYRWLFVHSRTKECPVCKGEVTDKTVTPIYGRGDQSRVPKALDPNVKIPSRPPANRIESWRQSIHRDTLSLPMLEMIRRLDNRFDLTRDTIPNDPQELPSTLLLNRIFTSRGIRSGRDTVPATSPDATVDLRNRDDSTMPNIPNLESAESFVESYFRDHPDEVNQEDEIPLIERHSMSSVAGIIESETDSRVSVSTTSRRWCESGSSRSRRRRLE